VYALWWWFVGLFLNRRCTVTLTNGRVVRWVRPRNVNATDYRAVFVGWKAASHAQVKLHSGNSALVIVSDDIVSFEIR